MEMGGRTTLSSIYLEECVARSFFFLHATSHSSIDSCLKTGGETRGTFHYAQSVKKL